MVICSHFFVFDDYIFIMFRGVFLPGKRYPGEYARNTQGCFPPLFFYLFGYCQNTFLQVVK